MLILWAVALLVTEGAIKLYDGGCRRLRRRPTAAAG
jgi:hypothetical protein